MNKKRTVCLIATIVIAVVVSSTWGAEKLRGVVAYSMKGISAKLDKSAKLLGQGDLRNAKAPYETAQVEWEALHKDFKGKFDVNHPEIVAMDKRFKDIGAKLKAAGVAVKTKESADTAPDKGDTAPQAPPAAMAYVMRGINGALDGAEKSAEAKNLKEAKRALASAEKGWKLQQKWNVGKYDPKHADVVALVTKLNRVREKVGGLDSQSAKAAENLPAVAKAITDASQKLDETRQKATWSIRAVSSLLSSYERGQENDVDKMRGKVDELRLCVEEVNALLPDALGAARAFRKQYPDFNDLAKLVREGRRAGQAVERLERFPAGWLEEVSRLVNEALDSAKANIKQNGLDRLKALKGADGGRKTIAAAAADKWVVEYSAFLLDVVPAALPELSKEGQQLLPEFVKARAAFMAKVEPMRTDIAKVTQEVGKVRKGVADASRRKLERARFPKTKYTGGKWNQAEKDIRKAWDQAIPDKRLLKVAIYSPWEVRSEARWRNNLWVVGTHRYIGAHCLAKLPSGKHMVYRVTFRNTKQDNGTWSPLKQWSVGHVYEMLKENIDK